MNTKFLLFTVLLLFSSCSREIMKATLVTTKPVDLNQFPQYQKGSSLHSGEDKKHMIVIIPLGHPRGELAIDQALESIPGAVALMDAVITYRWFYIPGIYGQYTYVVEGTPLIDPELVGQHNLEKEDQYFLYLVDVQGEETQLLTYSKERYQKLEKQIQKHPKRQFRKLRREQERSF